MISDALKYLVELGGSSAPGLVKPPAEPPHVYYMRGADGSLKKISAELPPDNCAAYSLQAILAVATNLELDAEVWYGPDQVVCVYGDAHRDRITLPLALSEQFLRLKHWHAARPALSQADLVRELRVTFRHNLGAAGNLVEILRRVNFRAVSTTDGEVGHGKASLGKAIAGEVTGVGTIPEYVTFDVPVFANACFRGVRAKVECALEPDAATGSFRVIPIPGELDAAMDRAVGETGEAIRDGLDNGEIAVFYGRP
jgi:hypothetical protein